ncbi:MAG: helix-turn-helix domain-containing protein [Bacteroidota bacterium]
METNISEQLQALESKIDSIGLSNKSILTFKEACRYLDFSSSYLYKLTSLAQIPHYKPRGKRVYFERRDLDDWLRQNRVRSENELESEAINRITMPK